MRGSGQLSLEYLLVLAVSLSAFAILVPLLGHVYSMAIFGQDSANAAYFSSAMQQRVSSMGFQADGSASRISARPFSSWRILARGASLIIAVQGPDSMEKEFKVIFPNELQETSFGLDSRMDFLLRKDSGKILLEYDNP